ncbi:flagellar hook-length control protein FliK [Marinobacter hydrocarbonoclasticus]|nr:flagellar hook-length control protein FliK [Marinobacter nauticus]
MMPVTGEAKVDNTGSQPAPFHQAAEGAGGQQPRSGAEPFNPVRLADPQMAGAGNGQTPQAMVGLSPTQSTGPRPIPAAIATQNAEPGALRSAQPASEGGRFSLASLTGHPPMSAIPSSQSGAIEAPRLGNTDLLTSLRQAGLSDRPMIQSAEGRAADTASATAALATSSHATTQASHQAHGRGLPQWGPLSLPGEPQQWAREMLTPLRDQLRFQFEQQVKSAELRLDPPDLGRIELNVRLEGERLIVQLNAANPTVREALQSGAERLRDELGQSHGGQVDVDVGQEGDGQREASPRHTVVSPGVLAAAPSHSTAEDRLNHQIDALA